MKPYKYILVLALILIVPLAYGFYMAALSYIVMSITESIFRSTGLSAFIILAAINIIPIIMFGAILSFPLNYIFKSHGYVVAIIMATSIVAWQIINFSTNSALKLNAINFTEWFALLICMPIIALYVNKLRGKNA